MRRHVVGVARVGRSGEKEIAVSAKVEVASGAKLDECAGSAVAFEEFPEFTQFGDQRVTALYRRTVRPV